MFAQKTLMKHIIWNMGARCWNQPILSSRFLLDDGPIMTGATFFSRGTAVCTTMCIHLQRSQSRTLWSMPVMHGISCLSGWAHRIEEQRFFWVTSIKSLDRGSCIAERRPPLYLQELSVFVCFPINDLFPLLLHLCHVHFDCARGWRNAQKEIFVCLRRLILPRRWTHKTEGFGVQNAKVAATVGKTGSGANFKLFFFALMTCERIFMNFQHFSISMNFTICREYQWMAIASYPRGDVQHIMDSLVVYPSFRAMQMFAASFGCSFNHSVHVGWKMRWQDLVEVRTLTENLATWQQLQILGGRQMQNLTRIKKPSTWISFHRLSCVFLYS